MHIVGIGGTVRPMSSSERALRTTMSVTEELGSWTSIFTGDFLNGLPMYDPVSPDRTASARDLVAALRRAEGIVISSAAYHGSPSGLLKNALDYTQDLSGDERRYLAGRPVGLISVAMGWQSATTNLSALRATVHALRGWPTPYGCIVNTAPTRDPLDPVERYAGRLRRVAREVVFGACRLAEPVNLVVADR